MTLATHELLLESHPSTRPSLHVLTPSLISLRISWLPAKAMPMKMMAQAKPLLGAAQT